MQRPTQLTNTHTPYVTSFLPLPPCKKYYILSLITVCGTHTLTKFTFWALDFTCSAT